MLTSDLFTPQYAHPVLQERCSLYIKESRHIPLFKLLPKQYTDCQRVKVRKQKTNNYITSPFNEAFHNLNYDIRQRAIFADGNIPLTEQEVEPFYVFPIDGYKYIYSKEVSDSTDAYKQVFEALIKQFGDNIGNEMLSEVLRFSYTSDKLVEGIMSGSEIVLHNIPFYYAVRVSSNPSYNSLF